MLWLWILRFFCVYYDLYGPDIYYLFSAETTFHMKYHISNNNDKKFDLFLAWKKGCQSIDLNQGDQIGRSFASWATFGGSLWFFERIK